MANKELMGHKTITMSQRYAYLSPGHLKEAVEGICKGIPSAEVSQIVSQEIERLDGGGVNG